MPISHRARRTTRAAALSVSLALLCAAPAAASPDVPLQPNDASPHNMGYCARFLGGGGVGVRPAINHLLAQQGELFGVSSPGELYSARARSTTDRACLAR
jgi:hypothetical protein